MFVVQINAIIRETINYKALMVVNTSVGVTESDSGGRALNPTFG